MHNPSATVEGLKDEQWDEGKTHTTQIGKSRKKKKERSGNKDEKGKETSDK